MQKLSKILIFILALLVGHVVLAEENNAAPYIEEKPIIMASSDHPEFTLKLKSNPTTGYRWYLQHYNSDLIEPVSQGNEPPKDKKIMGAPIYERWAFRVKPSAFVVPMQTNIRFVYIRPWEKNDAAESVTFKVTTNVAQ